MCELTEKYPKKQFVGYKAALRDKTTGKLYSIATFVEYKKGKVQRLTNRRAYRAKARIDKIIDPPFCDAIFMTKGQYAHSESLAGKTAAFLAQEHARHIAHSAASDMTDENYEAVIVRITLSDSKQLLRGKYKYDPVVAGDTIENIAVVKVFVRDKRCGAFVAVSEKKHAGLAAR